MSQIGEGAVVNYPVPGPLRVGRGVQAKLKQRGGGEEKKSMVKSDVRTPLSGAQKGKMPLRMN